MRNIILVLAMFFCTRLMARTITDMAGRQLSIPDRLDRVLPYDAKTSILLFSVAKSMMVAQANVPQTKAYLFIDEAYGNLPTVDIKNVEAVLSVNPQIIIAGTYSKKDVSRIQRLQDRTHIPVVIVDLSIDKLDKTYAFLGELFNNEDQCKPYVEYLHKVNSSVSAVMAKKSIEDIGVYYTIGGSGLMTDPSGSKHTEVLDYLKINNVAKVDIPTGGHANVNMEQVLEWNPDVIFTAGFKSNKNAFKAITTSSLWANVSAVKNDKVYKVPSQPFGWFDHPPSINRIPGILWLCQIFYGQSPELTQKQICEFYQLFYNYSLTAEEYQSLFK
nr:ABC transporter substrate-binding protein [uncultured Carboxylicivirga sp.]